MLLFARVERYYDVVGVELGLGQLPLVPVSPRGLVVVPVVTISAATRQALAVAMTTGQYVVAVTADTGNESTDSLSARWREWDPGVELVVLPSPTRGLVAPLVDFVHEQMASGMQVTVLIVELQPRRRRYEILHNQRGLVLAAALRQRTDAVVATLRYRLAT